MTERALTELETQNIIMTELNAVLGDARGFWGGAWEADVREPKAELTNEQRREAMLLAKKMRKIRNKKAKQKRKYRRTA